MNPSVKLALIFAQTVLAQLIASQQEAMAAPTTATIPTSKPPKNATNGIILISILIAGAVGTLGVILAINCYNSCRRKEATAVIQAAEKTPLLSAEASRSVTYSNRMFQPASNAGNIQVGEMPSGDNNPSNDIAPAAEQRL